MSVWSAALGSSDLSAGATNSRTSASRRSSRPGHLPRVLLSTVRPAAAEPSFLRQRSVEVGGQAGLAARRLVEGRLQAAFEVAAHQGLPGFLRLEAAPRAERVEPALADGAVAALPRVDHLEHRGAALVAIGRARCRGSGWQTV